MTSQKCQRVAVRSLENLTNTPGSAEREGNQDSSMEVMKKPWSKRNQKFDERESSME